MTQPRSNSDVFYLPEDIIRRILKRLPVKSLIRFQCVCKDWKNLIKNPSFIADHLQHSSHENPSLLLEHQWSNFPFRLYMVDCEMQTHEFLNTPSVDHLKGSCNGLLLVKHSIRSDTSHLLWNPATAAVRHIPLSKKCYGLNDCVMGFGFSPIVNDYKIVRICSVSREGVNRAEVFSVSRGTWKAIIDVGVLEGVRVDLYETVTANGAIFWMGDMEDRDVLVSFDIVTELFTLIPMPFNDDGAYMKLAVCKNKLAVLRQIGEEGGVIDLWVLDESTCTSGGTCGWAKIYTSRPFSCSVVPMAFWRNEIVFRLSPFKEKTRGTRFFYLMNITTNKVKSVPTPNRDPIDEFHGYVESLVSVDYTEES